MAKRKFSDAIEQSLQGRAEVVEIENNETVEVEVETKEELEAPKEENLNHLEEPKENNDIKTPSEPPNRPKQPHKSKSKDKVPPQSQKIENGAKFELKKKISSKKDNHSFYIKDINYEALLSLAKENNLSISEALDEILTQVLF